MVNLSLGYTAHVELRVSQWSVLYFVLSFVFFGPVDLRTLCPASVAN